MIYKISNKGGNRGFYWMRMLKIKLISFILINNEKKKERDKKWVILGQYLENKMQNSRMIIKEDIAWMRKK